MKELREYRDPFRSGKYYKNRERNKRINRIIIYLLVALVLILSYFLNNQENRITGQEKMLAEMKCLSLCPVNYGPDFQNFGSNVRYFDESCSAYCRSIYKEDLDKYKSKYVSKGKTDVDVDEFNRCYRGVADTQFDYESCFKTFFSNHKYIIDLSYYHLPYRYPSYTYIIDNIFCDALSARFKFSYTTGAQNITIYGAVKDNSGVTHKNVMLGELAPYRAGEYTLSFPSEVYGNVNGFYIDAVLDNKVTLTSRFIGC